jgi:hypothetical protein
MLGDPRDWLFWNAPYMPASWPSRRASSPDFDRPFLFAFGAGLFRLPVPNLTFRSAFAAASALPTVTPPERGRNFVIIKGGNPSGRFKGWSGSMKLDYALLHGDLCFESGKQRRLGLRLTHMFPIKLWCDNIPTKSDQ